MTSEEAARPDGFAGWTVDLMDTLGGPGAALAIVVDSVFPPIPSEVILPMAGFAARLGDLSLLGAIAWTTAGSVLGAWIIYGLGAWLGHERMRRRRRTAVPPRKDRSDASWRREDNRHK